MEAIAEMIGAVFGAIIMGLVAILELIISAIALAVEFIFVAITQGKEKATERAKTRRQKHLARREESSVANKSAATPQSLVADEAAERPAASHRSEKRIIAGVVALVLTGTAVAFYVSEKVRKQKVATTRLQVAALADQYADQIRDKSSEDPIKGTLSERDAWNQRIELFVDKGLLGSMIVVRSHGHDGKSGTIDDLLSIRLVRSSITNIGGNLAKKGFDKLRERLAKLLPEKEEAALPIEVDFNG